MRLWLGVRLVRGFFLGLAHPPENAVPAVLRSTAEPVNLTGSLSCPVINSHLSWSRSDGWKRRGFETD